jgi:hypothetical protein
MDDAQAARSFLTPDSGGAQSLSDTQIEQFIRDGFVRIDAAFPRDLADQSRCILWRDTGCDESNPTTWTKPVIRLGMYGHPPFARAANTPVLHKAFDQLAGPGRWRPRMDLGTFPIRFPSPDESHRGARSRFLAQPPLPPGGPFLLNRTSGVYSPVEQAIRIATANFG